MSEKEEQNEAPKEFNPLTEEGRIIDLRKTEFSKEVPKQPTLSLGDYAKMRRKEVVGIGVYDVGAPVVVGEQMRIPISTPTKVLQAYEDYFSLGPKRSLSKLARSYREEAEINGPESVPCVSYETLKKWSNRYRWDLQVRHDEIALNDQVRESRVDNAKEMAGRVSRSMKVLQSIGLNYIRQFVDQHGNLTEKAKQELSASEARRFIIEAAKLEKELYIESPEVAAADEEELFF